MLVWLRPTSHEQTLTLPRATVKVIERIRLWGGASRIRPSACM